MGAFGRFLQVRLGGTKHDVSTWSSSIKEEKCKEKILDDIKYNAFYHKLDISKISRDDLCCDYHWNEFINWKTPLKFM